MRKLIAGLIAIGFMTGTVWADPTVTDDPSGAAKKAREVVRVLTPSADVIYGQDHDFYAGASVDIVHLSKVSKHLDNFQVRAGWAETQIMFGTLSLDMAKITGLKYAKYVHAGFAVGYNFQDHDVTYGPVLGVKVEL